MNKIEYLKKAIQAKCFEREAWIISAFSVIFEGPEDYKEDPYPYRIVQIKDNFLFVNPDNGQLTPIELGKDHIKGEPLYKFSDHVVIDNSICSNVEKVIETCLGNLLYNLICIVNAFGKKIPFIEGVVDTDKVEDLIASRMVDTPEEGQPRNENVIYTDEYLKFVDSYALISALSTLCCYAATEKVMTPAPGIEKFKKNLIETKYKGKLTDPVQLAALEDELKAYDENYIKDDPANRGFLSGKIKDNARRKMFLMMGAERNFTDSLEANPVFNSLEEGWSTDPQQFTAVMDALRAGSYARGAETVLGGVTAKNLLRALINFMIVDEDCGTRVGLIREYDSSDYQQLVGKYVMDKNNWASIDNVEQAKTYIGKPIMVRSPGYCKAPGDRLCKFCTGKNLASNPNGIPSGGTDVSSVILATFMKQMHSNVLAVAKMNINKAFT